ncbi:dipeptidase [Rhodopirellula sp. MGV]|uniref:dipeptidase n=1 Tax=Rhodopirellula sp. MGV TaxID=2023130 RepID=UPI000B96D09B|nr:membrane dipeptidase [Rhodopirellula sp. MGV]OYP36388.1 peptidase M19 [Rhodopirellula sp. MGV]PNY38378.1 peptidase M19 [Rhodopirellula baltica]
MLIFDAHLDLSLNAMTYNRDLRQSVRRIRQEESGESHLAGWGCNTVAFPEMRKANIGICVATQLAGCMKPAAAGGGWNSPEQARAMTQGQLTWYRAMETCGELRQIRSLAELESHLQRWQTDASQTPIGYVLSLEGADSLRTLDDLYESYEDGLRAIGPAHYGEGRYAMGHDKDGPLSKPCRELLKEMDRLGVILDATHLCERTFDEALEAFHGTVWASHHNCRALVDDPRQLSDRQIKTLAERNAVIGIAFDIWMGVPGWQRLVSNHSNYVDANLMALTNHVDHICQLLGNTDHIGIGTDLDGGFGIEQTPSDLDTIADLPVFLDRLRQKGYGEDDLRKISHGNFLRVLRSAWH